MNRNRHTRFLSMLARLFLTTSVDRHQAPYSTSTVQVYQRLYLVFLPIWYTYSIKGIRHDDLLTAITSLTGPFWRITILHSISSGGRAHVSPPCFIIDSHERYYAECRCRTTGQRCTERFGQVGHTYLHCNQLQTRRMKLMHGRHDKGAMGIVTRTGGTIAFFGMSLAFPWEVLDIQ